MNNKTIAKVFFGISFLTGLVAAIFMASSYSENALTEYDWALRIILGSASLGFSFLAADSVNRNEKFTLIWLKVKWGYMYLFMSVIFMGVSATNVSQLYWPHIIATFLTITGAFSIAWNYFSTRWKRNLSIAAISAAVIYFIATFKFGVHTVAWGETSIFFVMIVIMFIIINEKVKKADTSQ